MSCAGKPSDSRLGISRGRLIASCLIVVLLCDTLAAYNIYALPIPWLAYLFAVVGLALTHRGRTLRLVPGVVVVAMVILYAAAVQTVWSLKGIVWPMPSGATTSYALFTVTRFVVLAGFGIVLLFSYNSCVQLGTARLIQLLVRVAVLIAIVTLYIYAAQMVGWWEPPRTRMGTGGQDFLRERLSFTYQYHRALGTFREPSHLAQWLVGPFLIVLAGGSGQRSLWVLGVLGATLILTGSVIGFLCAVAGISILLVSRGHRRVNIGRILGVAIVGAAVVLAVQATVGNVFGVVWARSVELIADGISATNRDYVQEYLKNSVPPILGYGLGNANLAFSAFRKSSLVQSHLSLWVNTWFALGAFGVVLMGWLVLRPLAARRTWRAARTSEVIAGLLAALVAWFVVFLGHAEELTVMYAVLCGVFWGAVREEKSLGRLG